MKGYIYYLKSPQTELIYIGSTIQKLSERLGDHRCNYKSWQDEKYHYVTSYEIVKFPDAYIELIEELEVEDEIALHKREGYYQRGMECVNKHIAGRTKQEWREDNKQHLVEYKNNWYKENKSDILEKRKIYRDEHKEELNEKSKIYQAEHKEEISEKRNVKCECECGFGYSLRNKSRHLKSKLHLDFISVAVP
jgi:hypothetical protein